MMPRSREATELVAGKDSSKTSRQGLVDLAFLEEQAEQVILVQEITGNFPQGSYLNHITRRNAERAREAVAREAIIDSPKSSN